MKKSAIHFQRLRRHDLFAKRALAWIGIFFGWLGAFAQAEEEGRSEPDPTPLPVPVGIEKFVVRTPSPDNPEVPFYVRPPKAFSRTESGRIYRVLLLCPLYDQDGLEVFRSNRYFRFFIEQADAEGWFTVVPSFRNSGDVRDRKTCYYYPETFSGKATVEALDAIRRKYPISTSGLLLQGCSGGAQFVHRFALWAPDRVAAVAVNSSSWFDPPDQRSASVGWLVTVGDSDPAYEASLEFVGRLREIGALPVLRSYIGADHSQAGDGNVIPLSLAFLTFYHRQTLPSLGKPKPLLARAAAPPIPAQAMPFIGDSQDWRCYEAGTEVAARVAEDSRVYLPSRELADVWAEEEKSDPGEGEEGGGGENGR